MNVWLFKNDNISSKILRRTCDVGQKLFLVEKLLMEISISTKFKSYLRVSNKYKFEKHILTVDKRSWNCSIISPCEGFVGIYIRLLVVYKTLSIHLQM
jgi:hypothetical protein